MGAATIPATLDWTPLGLWLAVIASGLFHGLNPGMGWPLAVSAGMMERSPRALHSAMGWLAAGHLLAMLLVLAPFALLAVLVYWRQPIQIAAGLAVTGFGLLQLARRRHPRMLARIPPSQLGLWSFTVAIAHGAGLMLVPIYLGLCGPAASDIGRAAVSTLAGANLGMAVLVSLVHAAAMVAGGGALAWAAYRYLGPQFIARSWFNLDAVWAAGLILVGAVSLAFNLVAAT